MSVIDNARVVTRREPGVLHDIRAASVGAGSAPGKSAIVRTAAKDRRRDWYSSVWICLTEHAPGPPFGGRRVVDDYDHWSRCRDAVDRYLATEQHDLAVERRQRVHLVRGA